MPRRGHLELRQRCIESHADMRSRAGRDQRYALRIGARTPTGTSSSRTSSRRRRIARGSARALHHRDGHGPRCPGRDALGSRGAQRRRSPVDGFLPRLGQPARRLVEAVLSAAVEPHAVFSDPRTTLLAAIGGRSRSSRLGIPSAWASPPSSTGCCPDEGSRATDGAAPAVELDEEPKQPLLQLLEGDAVERMLEPLSPPQSAHEARSAEDGEVSRRREPIHSCPLGEACDRQRSVTGSRRLAEAFEDLASAFVGERSENAVDVSARCDVGELTAHQTGWRLIS